jgi:type IV secretory pathway TraG/TraD family ATPase VirD4
MPSVSYAQEYAAAVFANLLPESVAKPDFWTRSAEAVLAAVFWFLHEHHPEHGTLPHAVAFLLLPIEDVVRALSTDTQCAGLVASVRQAVDSKAANQLSGVTSTLQLPLAKINTPEIAWVLSADDFNLNLNDPENPRWLVIGNSPTLSETYSPVLSLIATSCIKQLNQQNKAPSMVLLDEAPTLYIPKLDNLPATGRSNKVATVYAAQDLAQMVDRYGQVKADTLLANFGNQFYGRVSHPKTAEHVSRMFGKMDQEFTSTSETRDPGGLVVRNILTSSSESKSIQQRDRVKVQDVALLPPGQFIGMVVESPMPEFTAQFSPPEVPKPDELALVQQSASSVDVQANFEAVHQQARAILDQYRTTGAPGATSAAPAAAPGLDPNTPSKWDNFAR